MHRNILQVILFIIVFVAVIVSCNQDVENGAQTSKPNGKQLFKKHCVVCHGVNGKLQLNGAKDITQSALTKEERIFLIANGRNTMTAFGNMLSAEEIEAVANYTITLSVKQ